MLPRAATRRPRFRTSSCRARPARRAGRFSRAGGSASALLAEAGIVAPGVVGERNHAELHRKLAEVPVRAAPDALAVALQLGGGAARVGRLAHCGNDAEILVIRGLPDPPYKAPLVIRRKSGVEG